MNKLVYSMTKMVSVTQYVLLIMLKWFNISELDYVLLQFVVSAVRLQKDSKNAYKFLVMLYYHQNIGLNHFCINFDSR